MTRAGTARAGDVAGFCKGRAQTLTGQFHQAEAADFSCLNAGTVKAQTIAQAVFNLALVALAFHVNKIDDDQATEVTQAQLPGDLFGSFKVCLEGCFFDVSAAR